MTENDINIYNNGKIYTIRCKTDNDLIYVGSTIQPLHKRWHGHKNNHVKGKHENRLLYNKMNELGFDNFYIELHENYNCNSKEELNKREGEVIREIGNLNMLIAGRSKQEYLDENKEHFINYRKQYYKEHTTEKREYEKQYMSIPENREKRNEYQKQYKKDNYEKNKEHVKQQRSQPFVCECGCTIQIQEKTRHRKTLKHINLMEQKQEQN